MTSLIPIASITVRHHVDKSKLRVGCRIKLEGPPDAFLSNKGWVLHDLELGIIVEQVQELINPVPTRQGLKTLHQTQKITLTVHRGPPFLPRSSYISLRGRGAPPKGFFLQPFPLNGRILWGLLNPSYEKKLFCQSRKEKWKYAAIA